jgi:lysophospholipase L1-like esterase
LTLLAASRPGISQDVATLQRTKKATSAPELPFNPQDDETVVFLGDSITHQALYTQYIEDFFYTRYPNRHIRFHNAGVSGDKGADALVRFDEDVAGHHPDYVTILLGMNDGQYEDFNTETFGEYETSINALIARIESIGAKPILLSPTMFDHGQVQRRKNDETWRFRTRTFSPRYNALMAYYGGWLLENAARHNLPFVNLWGPLNEYTIAQRRVDPAFTLIGDAIHPQAAGQMVMAFELLSQLGVEKTATSSIVITLRGDRPIGRGIKDLEFDSENGTLSFSHKADALPWVIPDDRAVKQPKWDLPSDARVGYKITKAGHKLSGDRLKIVGLPPGQYEVLIDDVAIGNWTHVALGTKVEIQENEKTPQYQQALRVAELNRKRNDDAVRPMRDKWSTIKGLRRRYADDPEKLESNLAMARAAITELERVAQTLDEQIHQASQPVEHHWTIRPVAVKPSRTN